MEMTLRWFGTGYDTEPGEVWPVDRIRALKDEVAGAVLHYNAKRFFNIQTSIKQW